VLLDLQQSLDEGHSEAGLQMPFDVACLRQCQECEAIVWTAFFQAGGRTRRTVEEPDTRVIGDDTQGDGVHRGHLHGVSSRGVLLAFDDRRVESWVSGRVVLGLTNNLHLVSVQVAFVNLCVNF